MIYLGVPSARDWKPQFGVSVATNVDYLRCHGLECLIHSQLQVSNLPVGRESIIDKAIESGASHFVALDDDMFFPSDAIHTLIQYDVDVVGVDYRKKNKDPNKRTALSMYGKRFDNETGLQEAMSMGLGLVCIKMDVLKKTTKPRFEMLWRGDCYQGEDSYFFQKLHDVGAKIYCDLDLSRKVAHIGDGAFVIGDGDGAD